MRIHQIPVGPMRNFVYLIDGENGVGAVVDPAFEAERILQEAAARGLRIASILVTHGHPDHINAVEEIHRATGARVHAHASADHAPIHERHEDAAAFRVGAAEVRVIHTPGHRFDSVCYLVDGTHLLTGDTLFVGECGRVDLPGSSVDDMHRSLTGTLRALPDELVVLPGHDYGKTPTSTLGREKRENYTMQPRSLADFRRFMAEP
jgi:glyoxylase-like metal-dependent hydrolase (beta-lactamase superfamily II)